MASCIIIQSMYSDTCIKLIKKPLQMLTVFLYWLQGQFM